MAFREYQVAVTTTGSAGSASGTGTTPVVNGELVYIFLDYHASTPATADVIVSELGGATRTFLTRNNTATDGAYYPMRLLDDTVGASLTAIYGRFPVAGHKIQVAIAQGDALTNAVIAYIGMWEG